MNKKNAKKRQYSKEAVEKALNFIQNEGGSIRNASKQFGVPRSSLQFKIRNPYTKFKSGPDPILTEAEEKELCNFIIQLAKRGFPRKKEDIQLCVQDYLKENPRPNPFRDGKPGDVWFKAFLKRHPNICIRTSEGVTNASACVTEQDIRKWFQEIKLYIEEEDLSEVIRDPTRVFNADETGFNICPKTGKVLTEKGCKNVYEIEKGSAKENITVLFSFSAAGLVCNPLIIYPYKRVPDRVTLSVPSGWGIGRSDSGWMTAAVFYDYISNCFYQQLQANNIPLPVILFVDGHKTHLTLEVSNLCRNLKIHLIALYPNSTRILQPADVAAFRPIKGGWKKALREWYAANNYQGSLTKETFAPLLKTVVDSCAKRDTLINGFRVSGLFPFDPDNVDYSKCIASTSKPESLTNLQSPKTNTENSSVLTYTDFCDIVGKTIVEKCQTAIISPLPKSDDFMAIYKVWEHFNGLRNGNDDVNENLGHEIRTDQRNSLQATKSDNDSTALYVTKEHDVSDLLLDATTGEFRRNGDAESKIAAADRSREFPILTNLPDNDYSQPSCSNQPPILTNLPKNDNSQPSCSNQLPILTNLPKNDNSQNSCSNQLPILTNLAENDYSQPSCSKQLPIVTNLAENDYSQPSCSNQVVNQQKKITILSNVSLSDYLKTKKLPDPPTRKGKRQSEKAPFALTSDSYVEMIKAKQHKKQEEENAKQERKRLREEKKVQKENVPKKTTKKDLKVRSQSNQGKEKLKCQEETKKSDPIPKKATASRSTTCCDSCLSPITRKIIECSQCKKKFHLNCIPSRHRVHIPEDEEDSFLCHICYQESNTDSSDDNDNDLFSFINREAKNQGF